MCEKEVISTVTNYRSSNDKIWVKEAEDAVEYKDVIKRLSHCKLSVNIMLYIDCNKYATPKNFEHLLKLEGIFKTLLSDKATRYFKSESFKETKWLKGRKAFMYIK